MSFQGAGSAGASTAYFLKKFQNPCQNLNITIFERSDYVGGRSTTVNVYNDPSQRLELGASIFVEVNRNLVSAAKEFRLELKEAGSKRPKETYYALGVWDGQGFRFTQSESGYWWFNLAKLLWRYGLSPIRTRKLVKATIGTFLKMYEAPVFPFTSLTRVANDLGLVAITSASGESFLAQNGILPPFSTDIIQASTRVNYAQNLSQLHGLETIVCMATDSAMAVEGGNWQIFDRMIEHSGANLLLNETVFEVSKQKNGTFIVSSYGRTNTTNDAADLRLSSSLHDMVIVSTPLQFSNIKLAPAPKAMPAKVEYVHLHVTLFTSPHNLSHEYFKVSSGSEVPEIILTTTNRNDESSPPPFFSISKLRKVSNPELAREEYAYKIFSHAPLEPQFLSKLLSFSTSAVNIQQISKDDISWIHTKNWASYPYLSPIISFDGPQLDKGLFYTSGIESFISTMETSSLMGMNVAKLILEAGVRAPDQDGAGWEL